MYWGGQGDEAISEKFRRGLIYSPGGLSNMCIPDHYFEMPAFTISLYAYPQIN